MFGIKNLGKGGLIMAVLFLFIGLLVMATVSPVGATVSGFMLIGLGTVYSEPNYLGDVIFMEADNQVSREAVTVLSGQNLLIGTVLGKILLGAVTETHAGNTGNGAMTIDAATPRLANCQAGIYKAVCIAAAANGGTFEVFDPIGNSLGEIAVGGTFANQIKFVIADGATDFIVGDTFLVTVAEGSGKVKILTPAGLDGTQYAHGIITSSIDASAGDLAGAAIARDAIAKDTGLVWPAGITDGEKAAALAELEENGILTREGV